MTPDAEQLIAQAREGNAPTLGVLLEQYRNYLRVLARIEIGQHLQGKVDASDVVQDTMMDAYRYFPNFRGTVEPQFIHWLRQILAGRLANLVRHYFGTQARDIRLEQKINDGLDRSSAFLDGGLVAVQSSPSEQVARQEQAVVLANALSKLPDDYREVIVLRNIEGLTFAQVAEHMGKTVDSVDKLWLRALARLRIEMSSPASGEDA